MPSLPVYNSQRNISANPVAPFRNEVNQPFQDQQKVLGAVQDVTQKWSDANDVMQYTEAKAKYEVTTADIQSRAAADPNFKDSKKYFQELEDAKSRSLEGISNKQVGNKLGLEFDYGNQIAKIKIDANFKHKQMVSNKYNVQTEIQSYANSKGFAVTDAEKKTYSDKIDNALKINLASGLLSREEADEIRQKSELNAAENLIYSNPQTGINEISKGTFLLSPENKVKLINEARQIEKKNKEFADWQLQQTQTQGVIELSEALNSNVLTPMMVRKMQQDGRIDSETAAIFDSIAVNKKYEIPSSTSLAEPDYFLRLIEDSNGDKTQIKKVLKDAATAYGNNKIGTLQYLYFIQNAKESFDRQSKGVFTKSKGQQDVLSAIEGIKSFAANFTPQGAIKAGFKASKEAGKMIINFFDRFKQGDDPNKIKSEIINEKIVESKPEVATFPKEGKILVDKNGNKARVFPDGHIEEIK